MAWCNTIGGAHSSLGDSYSHHVCMITPVGREGEREMRDVWLPY